MALVVKDRVKVSTTTTGTGTISLGTVATGFQDFSAIGDGNTTYYAVMSGSQWEVGIGTYTASGDTLSRDTILDSSNSGSAITLAGTSDVFCAYPAENSVSYDKETVLTGFLDVPAGTTAERPSVPDVGMIRFNTSSQVMESYDGGTWRNMYDPRPEITSVSPTDFDGETGTTITVNGNYFSSGAVVQFKKTGGSYGNGANIQFINSNQLTADTTEDYDLTESPISVQVVQDSGSDELANAITMGSAPVWSTPSGNLVTVNEGAGVSTSVTATDDGSIASYGVVSGALPGGVSLNTSTGAITGTAPSVSSNTVYNFTIRATDNVANTTDRAFSITVNNINYDAYALIQAGGGGGGSGDGAGGGAGGFRFISSLVTIGTGYGVTVGGGGVGGIGEGPTRTSTNGGNSSVFGTTSTGGGRGGQENNRNGGNGGSGGGGGGQNGFGAGGSGTAGQGTNGSNNSTGNSRYGGGGGATQAGGLCKGGDGNGTYSTWLSATASGSGGRVGAGGGGASRTGGNTAGGIGGGGNAPSSYGGNGNSAVAYTGSGGGGSGDQNTTAGNGAGGLVIIRTPDTTSSSGGTLYVSGGFRYHRFRSSGTFTA